MQIGKHDWWPKERDLRLRIGSDIISKRYKWHGRALIMI